MHLIRTLLLFLSVPLLLFSLFIFLITLNYPASFIVINPNFTASDWTPVLFWPSLGLGLFTLYFSIGGKP